MNTSTENPVGVRMPPDLRDRLRAAAKLAKRSMNAEICLRLETSFENNQLVAPGKVRETPADYRTAVDIDLTPSQQQHLGALLAEERHKPAQKVEEDQLWIDCMSLVVDCIRAARVEVTPNQFAQLVEAVYQQAVGSDTPPPSAEVVSLIESLAA